MKAAVAVGRVLQSRFPDTLQLGLLLPFPLGLLGRLLPGIPQFPDGNFCFAGEAGEAQVRMVSKELLVDTEKLSRTQRPRTFFAI